MSTVFLFGAGASAYSLDCTPSCPPLGKDLFAALQAQGGVSATFSPELVATFTTNFEDGVAALRSSRPVDLLEFLRDLARYFAQFAPGPNNLYRQLIRLLVSTRFEGVLASINYDVVLELAINAEGPRITYHGLPVPPGNLSVLKLHGSCNFLPVMQPGQISGIGFDVGPTGSVLEADVRPVTPAEAVAFCDREDSVAPVLALYVKGKQVLICPSFVRAQVDAWSHALSRATRAFVVGVRVNPDDDHIWGALAHSPARLFYVGPDPASFFAWAREHKRKRVHAFAPSFEEAVPLWTRLFR